MRNRNTKLWKSSKYNKRTTRRYEKWKVWIKWYRRCKKNNNINSKDNTRRTNTEITYYFGQEISNIKYTLDEYVSQIQKVTKEQIIDLAQKISINTIYFLRD